MSCAGRFVSLQYIVTEADMNDERHESRLTLSSPGIFETMPEIVRTTLSRNTTGNSSNGLLAYNFYSSDLLIG